MLEIFVNTMTPLEPMLSTDRFFAATILGGRLHVSGISEWGSWDSARLERFTEPEIAPGLITVAGDRMVHTVAELEEVLKDSTGQTPTRKVWIHESLEDEGAAAMGIGPR